LEQQTMIEINLLPGKKKKRAAGAGLAMPDFAELLKGIRDPLLIGAIAVWAIVLPVVGFIFVSENSKVAALQEEAEQIRSQARRFQAVIREKRLQERLFDSLQVELQAIRDIDADRYVWAHVMDEVAKALPDFTWLTALEFVAAQAPVGLEEEGEVVVRPPVSFHVTGRTADIYAYTRFLRNLTNSPWITNVRAGQTTQLLEEERAVQEFSITAMFQQADSAFIRIAPLQETLR
jgi:Tfp pilus assembly protein PilN